MLNSASDTAQIRPAQASGKRRTAASLGAARVRKRHADNARSQSAQRVQLSAVLPAHDREHWSERRTLREMPFGISVSGR